MIFPRSPPPPAKRLDSFQQSDSNLRVATTNRFKLVLVTAPDIRTARRLATGALKARLIACANLVPKVESHYWWQGRIERGAEVLMILKTTRPSLPKLEKLVLTNHPYDVPEFIILDPSGGNRRYLRWLAGNCDGADC